MMGRGHHENLARITTSPGLFPLYTVVQASLYSQNQSKSEDKLYCYSICSSFSTLISSGQEQLRGSLFMEVEVMRMEMASPRAL